MAELVEMENFPPGNPFHFDAVSVGMNLRDVTLHDGHVGWYIMSHGFLRKDIDFYLVNAKTGERVGVKL